MNTASLIIAVPIVCLLLCVVTVACSVLADRASRAHRKFLALLLNLCGVAALMVGFWTAWQAVTRHHGPARAHRARHVVTKLEARPGQATAVRVAVRYRSAETAATERPDKKDADSTKSAQRDSAGMLAEKESDVKKQPDAGDANGRDKKVTEKKRPVDEPDAKTTGQTAKGSGPPKKKPPKKKPTSVTPEATLPSDAGKPNIKLLPEAYIDFDARPEWVDRDELDVGPSHQISVSSGPFLRAQDARRELYKQLKIETDRYIDQLLDNPQATRWLDYGEAEIRTRWVNPNKVYHEKIVSPSFGVMHQSHALLQFDPDFREEVQQHWHQVQARGRLAEVALGAGLVLGVLGLLFGYFQVDTATRGFYSGRLRITTAVAILGLIAVGIWLAQSIPWIWL